MSNAATPHPDSPRVDPFAPVRLGSKQLRNRFIKAATFEGMADDNLVSERLLDFHGATAAGGIGMSTLAYLAVSRDGQGAPSEIVVGAKAAAGLARAADAIHAGGAAASAQLGHAGPVGIGARQPGYAPSRIFNPFAMRFTRAATDDDIERITRDFARAALVLRDAGFDAIELHLAHNYLLSAFLSPALNKRRDRWGGTIERRAAFPRQVILAVREAVGPDVALLAKLNMADGYPGGIWLDESIRAAELIESDGALDAIVLTGGSSYKNPMYLFRGEAPVAEMAASVPPLLRPAFKVLGRTQIREYPFEEAYFLPYARQFRAALRMPLVLLGGINRLETVHRALDEGFDFVAMGRALLREPDLVARWQRGGTEDALCIHCNKCMPTIYTGTHCVLVPPEARPGHRGLRTH
jgi:2,4-dienoyl-CoA reductase-like NADH-dependent reductase (Old Yellow Enzyme family)